MFTVPALLSVSRELAFDQSLFWPTELAFTVIVQLPSREVTFTTAPPFGTPMFTREVDAALSVQAPDVVTVAVPTGNPNAVTVHGALNDGALMFAVELGGFGTVPLVLELEHETAVLPLVSVVVPALAEKLSPAGANV